MKTTALFLTLFFISSLTISQTTAIPDTLFEQALIDLGYDSGVPDGEVPTANIDTVAILNVSFKNISDLTGIEDFAALTNLSCQFNSLTSLNIANNTMLVFLDCSSNTLASLDVSNNTSIECLVCHANSLTRLDLRNGNNIDLQCVSTLMNPNLFCITVDDPWYSTINWPASNGFFGKDNWSRYSSSFCGANKVSGVAYYDKNKNCIQDVGEQGVDNMTIRVVGSTNDYTTTNETGYYELFVDSNTSYHMSCESSSNMSLLINEYCPIGGYTINSGIGGTTTPNIDFGLDMEVCALPSVDVSANRMRRCFKNTANITYRNEGPIAQGNAEVFVDFPEYVKLLSASESYILVDSAKSIYKFNIDSIEAFGKGTITLLDSVICGNEGIRGYTQCIKAWITPPSSCGETKDTTVWDKSSIKVVEAVECIGDSIARFIIINHGSGDMLSAHEYHFYYDNQLAYTGTFQLNSGDSMLIDATVDGSTIRIEADQHPLHPGKSRPRTTIEGCGSPTPATASLGFWPQAPNDDLNVYTSEVCLEIRDSYDPNDKTVSPKGISNNHYVSESDPLKYTIRFQNTGSDTAYKIIVVDTLSNQLDLSTLKVNGASHDFEYEIVGKDVVVLAFTFNDINLPDSTTDELRSHGFVSFTISPIDGIAPKTQIENFGDIYFDFNSAVRTNTATVIVLDTIINSGKIITVIEGGNPVGISKNELLNISIFPNPSNNYIFIKGINKEFNQIQIYNVMGKLVVNQTLSLVSQGKVGIAHLETGSYFIHLVNDEGIRYTFKMIKQKTTM